MDYLQDDRIAQKNEKVNSKKDTRKGTQYLFFWPTGETLLRHSWNIDRDKSVKSYSTKGPMTKLEK